MLTIIMLTNKFPFIGGETFLYEEVQVGIQRGINYIFVPMNVDHKRDICMIDGLNQYEVIDISQYKNKKNIFNIVFEIKVFSRELQFLYSHKKLCINTIRWALSSLVEANRYRSILDEICASMRGDVLLYSYWGTVGALAIVMTNSTNIKKIMRVHRIDLYEYLHKKDYIPFCQEVYSRIDSIFPISQDGATYLSNRYPSWAYKIHLSRLGTSDYGLGPMTNLGEKIIIVSCSNIIKVKRVPLIAEVLSNIMEIPIHWVHFGNGNEINDVFAKVCTNNNNFSFEMKGHMPKSIIMKWYRDNYVDLFINASLNEGIPVSIMEAFSFGIPAIATNVGGTSEIVDNKNGWLIDSQNASEMIKSSILNYYNMSKKEREKKRFFARKTWEIKFDSNKNYNRYFDKICEIYNLKKRL